MRRASAGFEPRRTVHFGFGHDEEFGGPDGAQAIVEHFQDQGMRAEFILDEGMMVVDGIIPGLQPAAALVGIAEKGYANVELTVSTPGGHSSVPPSETAVGILARAIARLEANPMPARMEGPVQEMFRWVAPEMSFGPRIVLSNLWLFGPMVQWKLARSPATNATIRTTAAPTMLQASDKANVLARRASALINYRLLPGDSLVDVLAHVRREVDDERVEGRTASIEVSSTRSIDGLDGILGRFAHIGVVVL